MNKMETYETDNFYEAAYLKCVGLELLGKTRKHNKTYLIFKGEDADQLVRDYYNGATVEANAFVNCHRDIKEYGFGTSN